MGLEASTKHRMPAVAVAVADLESTRRLSKVILMPGELSFCLGNHLGARIDLISWSRSIFVVLIDFFNLVAPRSDFFNLMAPRQALLTTS